MNRFIIITGKDGDPVPKIIDNLRQKLIEQTRSQIQANGYGALTVRAVAECCGVGVGTVYNYFPSKDAMVACCLLQDWEQALDGIRNVCAEAQSADRVLCGLCEAVESFMRQHRALFVEPAAQKAFASAVHRHHSQLRGQLAGFLAPLCRQHACEDPDFRAQFLSEAILTWVVAGKTYAELAPILCAILPETHESKKETLI